MPDTLSRPARPRVQRPSPNAGRATRRRANPRPAQPLAWAAVLAALRAAGLSLLAVMVLVLVAWATAADSGASASEAVAAGLQIWLVGHGAHLAVPGGEFGLLPLGLTALPAALLFSSASRAARAAGVCGRRGVARLTAVVAATYAAVAVVLSLFARTDVVQPLPVSAFLGAGAVACLAGGAGAVRGSGRAAAWWAKLPGTARAALAGACGATAVTLATGSALAGLMLTHHHGRATALARGLDAAGAGDLLILLVCLLYVPTAAIWGATYVLGPGFAVGAGTSVAATATQLGAVPSLPLLAALPTGAGSYGWAVVVTGSAAAAVVAGWLADRSARREPADPAGSWKQLARTAGLTGVVAGALLGGLAAATSGPAGPGRLTHVGPTWWAVGLLAAAEVTVAVAAVLALRRRSVLWGARSEAPSGLASTGSG